MKLALVVLLVSATAASAQGRHPCADDAVARSTPLLKLHFDDDEGAKTVLIDASVKSLPPIRPLAGNGRLDVLETWGHIYRANYRMRFIYAQIPGSCVLMGQEILEASNPY